MTSDERVIILEGRVERLETELWDELKSIKDLLTHIQISAAGAHCPAPGRCLVLEPVIHGVVERVARIESTNETLAKTVADLIRWRAWLTGISVVLSSISVAMLAALCNYIAKHL